MALVTTHPLLSVDGRHRKALAPIATPDRLLLGPGPSNAHPTVLKALSRTPIGHLDPLYVELMGEVQDLLRYAWQTDNRLTLPMSGTGSAAMEATLANTVEPGDTVLVAVKGARQLAVQMQKLLGVKLRLVHILERRKSIVICYE